MNFSLAAPLQRTSLAESVYETLLEAICLGRIPRGTVLSAVALSQQLCVSRTPVVEALRRLTADGLLTAQPGRKARLTEFTRDEIADVYNMRTLLEGAACERAASNLNDQSLQDLLQECDQLIVDEDDVDWLAHSLDFDCRLHSSIANAAGSSRLRAEIARYRLLVRGLCRMNGTRANLRAALAEHRAILVALSTRDSLKARQAMVHHINARLAAVLNEMNRSSSPDVVTNA